MIGAAARRRSGVAAASTERIVQPGRNCWRLERASRFYCIQDGADYFRLVRQALLEARETVFILGWDIAAQADLCPDRPGARRTNAPRRTARLCGATTTAASVLHPGVGLRRTLYARA